MSDEWGREAFLRLLDWTLREERATAAELPAAGRQAFLDYHASLPDPGDAAALERHRRGTWRSEAGWVARRIARRRAAGRPVRLLDAGAGFGTYAMLFAAAGAEVVAVDLRADRLEVARARVAACRARLGLPLVVHCTDADLTRPWDSDYDLVWVYNAISHIDPAERFLAEARSHLSPGGALVIGDINGAQRGHVRRLAGLREQVHQEYVTADGQRAAYAVERLFPPAELRALARANGFRVAHHELLWGGLGVAPEPVYALLLRPLQACWRLGTPFARRQFLVAEPEASAGR